MGIVKSSHRNHVLKLPLTLKNFHHTISTIIDIVFMNKCNKAGCKPKALKLLADNLQIIAEPNRLKILCLLSSGPKCVCEIEKEVKLKQNLISHHLKVLRENGLVKVNKQGLWRHYSVNNKSVNSLISNLTEILNV